MRTELAEEVAMGPVSKPCGMGEQGRGGSKEVIEGLERSPVSRPGLGLGPELAEEVGPARRNLGRAEKDEAKPRIIVYTLTMRTDRLACPQAGGSQTFLWPSFHACPSRRQGSTPLQSNKYPLHALKLLFSYPLECTGQRLL